ncbi:MAG: hypothetical protein EPN38_09385 [Rhodanobacteraceae bacterium]|nr:MAG: hypothetical protein EPN38_09385 [Rhodanobacteraceae bacterium]
MTPKDCFREHPILFSAPMVRAILDGLKTQTRRVVRLNDAGRVARAGKQWHPDDPDAVLACPFGQPGDRLWVRETCRAEELESGLDGVRYVADRAFMGIKNTQEAEWAWADLNAYRGKGGAVVPAIHMPRWASRITLEVTGVRMERLQDISEADATAEGARAVPWGTWWQGYQDLGDMDLIHQEARGEAPPEWMIEPKRMKDRPWLDRSAVAEFRTLWESINGAGNWDANPWVWVVEFRRIDHGDVA